MLILVDVMGGDNAPIEIVKGCVDAINEKQGFDLLLLGNEDSIKEILKEKNFSSERISIRNTTEVITSEDTPTKAIKNKKDSSMVVGLNLLKEKIGDALVSAGNTGALMTGALLILGRIKGVDRPALPSPMPTKKGNALLVDAGANTMCKPVNYLQFGIMGSIYVKETFGVSNPKVGLVNVGVEENKGSETVRQAHALLKSSGINFIGNIEGRDMLEGNTDVIVCDGFVGNVTLKFLEGCGDFFFGSMKQIFASNLITKLSALVVKSKVKVLKKRVDPEESGGVPLLGVNGKVIKCHGSSKAMAIKNGIVKVAYRYANSSVIEQIREQFKNMEVEDIEQTS